MPTDFDPARDQPMTADHVGYYKVFSTDRLTPQQLSAMFEKYEDITEVNWKAYPKYRWDSVETAAPAAAIPKFVVLL